MSEAPDAAFAHRSGEFSEGLATSSAWGSDGTAPGDSGRERAGGSGVADGGLVARHLRPAEQRATAERIAGAGGVDRCDRERRLVSLQVVDDVLDRTVMVTPAAPSVVTTVPRPRPRSDSTPPISSSSCSLGTMMSQSCDQFVGQRLGRRRIEDRASAACPGGSERRDHLVDRHLELGDHHPGIGDTPRRERARSPRGSRRSSSRRRRRR